MPKRVGIVTKQDLVAVPLPPATATYTVISHGFVIDNVLKTLEAKGFKVIKERYTCNDGGQVATGQYHINYGDDPELGMLFAFSNSYDKTLRFRCAIGGFVRINDMSVLGDTSSSWGRKHTGSADDETIETIEQQIDNAQGYFKQLKADKELMKKIKLSTRQYAELLGRLYLDIKMISGEQLRVIKREFEKPSFGYTTDPDSLWTLYNHILIALSKCHPRTWMEQQKLVHLHLMSEYQLTMFDEDPAVKVKDPNQLDLVEEAEKLLGMDDNPEIPSQEEINAGTYAEAVEPEELTSADLEEEDTPEIPDILPAEPDGEMQESTHVTDLDAEEDEDWEKSGMVPVEATAVISEGDDGYGATNAEEEVLPKAPVSKPTPEPAPEPVADEPADEPAEKPKPTITMKEALEKYGHLVSDEERELLPQGKGSQESIQILRDAYMADQANEETMPSQEVQAVTNAEESDAIEEEITPAAPPAAPAVSPVKGEDASKLQSMPTQNQLETNEVESVVKNGEERDIDELENSEFFITKSDLDAMYSGTTLELGFVVNLMDQDCEITTCDPDALEYGLTPLTDDFADFDNSLATAIPAILGTDSPEEEAEVREALADAGLALPKAPEPVVDISDLAGEYKPEEVPAVVEKLEERISEATSMKEVGMEEQQAAEQPLTELDPEPETISDDFEIGDAEVGVPAETMLATTSVKEDLAPKPTAEDLAIKAAIETEIEDLYGARIPFTYKLSGNQYNVKLETGETVVLTEAYIKSLNTEV